jgi:hypothetical protein
VDAAERALALDLTGASKRGLTIASRAGFCASASSAHRARLRVAAAVEQRVPDVSEDAVLVLISDNYNKLVRARDIGNVKVRHFTGSTVPWLFFVGALTVNGPPSTVYGARAIHQGGQKPITSVATISELAMAMPAPTAESLLPQVLPYRQFTGSLVLAVLEADHPARELERLLPPALFGVQEAAPPAKLHDFVALPSKALQSSRVVDMARLLVDHLRTTFAPAIARHGVVFWILDTETYHVIEVRSVRGKLFSSQPSVRQAANSTSPSSRPAKHDRHGRCAWPSCMRES